MGANRIVLAIVVAALGALAARTAYAHGFGERYDLPVPLNYFLVGAGATVALSFVVIGFFVHHRPGSFDYPRYNLLGPRWLASVLTSPILLVAIKAVSVALFGLVMITTLFGSNKPIENFSPVFVWIIWWVGMSYISALLGNIWALINPWKIIFQWAETLIGSSSDRPETGMYRYPDRWGAWPALMLFLFFAWLENVYAHASTPRNLGILVLGYSAITWGGMLAFGKHRWLQSGEAFSVLFSLFARFSPTEVRVTDQRTCDGCEVECGPSGGGCVDCYRCFERVADARRHELNIRPYAVGLANPAHVSAATMAFVVLALATVTYDGLTATPLWQDIVTNSYDSAKAVFGSKALEAINTGGLVLLPLVFLSVYLVFSWAIRRLSSETAPVYDVARAFVFALVPIALAYNLAHFVSLLAIQGQAIIPLVSDPFGYGWDLFGTADYRIDIGVIGARSVWFTSVVAIVLGHIISVYIAHVISLRRVPDRSSALRGQYPMLVLMVMYTATSLWIIAQPIVSQA